ncbi:MAG: tRNA wybutosine-synthesizing protein 2 [Candidatus Methanomethylophilaceae archaeon]|nr:tRNA wybutosine-synthesizing protein 2 [Candidatus Methanomethylophilaceae archaeon]MDI3541153.1 tRNA wybutosine-synthesizing protein 2 [Candidatus Methanomethylophilaceae archaeon]HIJ00243.1 class I SAM-dependent methyltransferase family protein [Candidatus Methanomethylophilaceae archaeon]
MRLALVPRELAAETVADLLHHNMIVRNAKISRSEEIVLIPVNEAGEKYCISIGLKVIEGETHGRKDESPHRLIQKALDLPEEKMRLLPHKWELFGDLAIIRLDERLREHEEEIGRAYAKALGVSSVCVDRGGVKGEFRQPTVDLIYGETSESVRLENGILYKMDVCKLMFASGNVDERARMGELDCKGEIIVDMFAGIGYFTLPLAKYTGAEMVYACEKNPVAFKYLQDNIRLNDVTGKVCPVLGDNRSLPLAGIADRVVMGYLKGTRDFLWKGFELVAPGGVIHFHETYNVKEMPHALTRDLTLSSGGREYKVETLREVKSFAPSVSHYVADIKVYD